MKQRGTLTALEKTLDQIWTRSAKNKRAEPISRETDQHTAKMFAPLLCFTSGNKHKTFRRINTTNAARQRDTYYYCSRRCWRDSYALHGSSHPRHRTIQCTSNEHHNYKHHYSTRCSRLQLTRRDEIFHAFHTPPKTHLACGPLLRLNHLYLCALFYELAVVAKLNKPSVLTTFKTSTRHMWSRGREVRPQPIAKRTVSQGSHTDVHKREQQPQKKLQYTGVCLPHHSVASLARRS